MPVPPVSLQPGGRRARRCLVTAVLLLAGTALSACGDSAADESADSSGSSAGFPVTIENTFGETTIEDKPERIVTLGWNAQDVVYALGETPVGMPKYAYGADKNGVMPWAAKYYDEGETELLDTTDGQPYEEIAKLRPDVILAPYEGFDKATYDKLSKIAPTVAYPDKPWQTSWQDQTTIVGKAMGKSAEAKKLVDETEASMAAAAEKHPEFDGRTLSVSYFGSKLINVYLPSDPRVQILGELGFDNSQGVEKLAKSTDDGQFYADLSWENVSDVDADVVVGYIDDMTREQFAAKPTGSLSAVENDSAVVLDDTRTIAGLSQPTVLSIDWTLDRILPELSKAAKNAG